MPKTLWENDRIQFARLLCEIRANIAGTSKEWKELRESMDLTESDVSEIFDRAEKVFESSKRQVFKRGNHEPQR